MTSSLERFAVETPLGGMSGWQAPAGAAGPLPVLFVHPTNMEGLAWGPLVERLDPPRRALLPDLRGHGASAARGPYGVDPWADDCLAVLDQLGIERAHVAGASVGGLIAVALAARAPERVASVTALGSTLAVATVALEPVIAQLREHGVQELFRRAVPEVSVAPGASPEVIDAVVALSNHNDVETVVEVLRAAIVADVRERAADVRCPALVVTGEHDVTCPPEQGEQLATALGTELVRLDGVGHTPMIEAPERVAELLNAFLTGAEATASVA